MKGSKKGRDSGSGPRSPRVAPRETAPAPRPPPAAPREAAPAPQPPQAAPRDAAIPPKPSPPRAPRPAPKASWAVTVALAALTALSVAVTGLVGWRTGRGDAESLVLQLHTQQAKIAQLTSDLDKIRAERDRMDAELRAAKSMPPAPPRPTRAGHSF
jgi:hypothetical protein